MVVLAAAAMVACGSKSNDTNNDTSCLTLLFRKEKKYNSYVHLQYNGKRQPDRTGTSCRWCWY